MSFNNLLDVKNKLLESKHFLDAFYHKGYRCSNAKIIQASVGANTLRAFDHKKKTITYFSTPSSIFRNWASTRFFPLFLDKVKHLKTYNAFHSIHSLVVEDLRAFWKGRDKCSKRLNLDYGCKLVDLLFKFLPNSNDLSAEQSKQLKKFIHVPLDSYTLSAVRELWNDTNHLHDKSVWIPRKPGMGLIKNNRQLYDDLQSFIRKLMLSLKVNPIDFDLISYRMSTDPDNFPLVPVKQKK